MTSPGYVGNDADADVPYLTPRVRAGFYGFAQWAAEAVVGLIPLLAYVVSHQFSKLPIAAVCPQQTPGVALGGCIAVAENASQEICILAVVISGLAVLSTVPMGQHNNRQVTIFTRFLMVAAVMSLLFGSILYSFFTAHLDRNADAATYYVLAAALLSSLFLAIEGAILSA